MTITLDGIQMSDRTVIHALLSEALAFPAHYGKNLDALYDMLTERSAPLTIIVTKKEALSGYGLQLMHTLRDAANNNPAINVEEKDC